MDAKRKIDFLGNPPYRVMLAEDNAVNRIVMAQQLAELFPNLEIAKDGTEAMELLQKNYYDIVLLDQYMPGANGTEITTALRQKETGKRALILIISAEQTEEALCRYREAGADGAVEKPISMERLREMVSEYFQVNCGKNDENPPVSKKTDEEYSRFLQAAVESLKDQKALQKPYEESSVRELFLLLHSYKGILAVLTESEIMKETEEQLRILRLGEKLTKEKYEELCVKYDRIMNKWDEKYQQQKGMEEKAEKNEVSKQELVELLKTARHNVALFDYHGALSALSAAKDGCPPAYFEQISACFEAAEAFFYDQAEKEIRELLLLLGRNTDT